MPVMLRPLIESRIKSWQGQSIQRALFFRQIYPQGELRYSFFEISCRQGKFPSEISGGDMFFILKSSDLQFLMAQGRAPIDSSWRVIAAKLANLFKNPGFRFI